MKKNCDFVFNNVITIQNVLLSFLVFSGKSLFISFDKCIGAKCKKIQNFHILIQT